MNNRLVVRRWRRTTLGSVALALLLSGSLGSVGVMGEGRAAFAQETAITEKQFAEDFDRFWEAIDHDYAYFGRNTTDWKAVRTTFHSRLAGVHSRREFVNLLEAALDELCDAHTQLNTNTPHSYRLVPSAATVWAEWRRDSTGEAAVVSEVRPGSRAEALGLKTGDVVEAIGGVPVAEAVRKRMGPDTRPDNRKARNWALLSLLAGRHDEAVRLTVRHPAETKTFVTEIAGPDGAGTPDRPPLETRMLASKIGYIRLNNSLGDDATIAAFDAALERLRDSNGLVLDLRDTPGGGNTVVARAIMGRFISTESVYQKHVDVGEERATGVRHAWLELVAPRGPFRYAKTLVVLVDHWTGSMGEGMAIGFDGMGRATVVGTSMAGLVGAKRDSVSLPNTGIAVSFPVEKLFHVGGTPREQFVPPVPVDLSAGGEDPILRRGLGTFAKANKA